MLYKTIREKQVTKERIFAPLFLHLFSSKIKWDDCLVQHERDIVSVADEAPQLLGLDRMDGLNSNSVRHPGWL